MVTGMFVDTAVTYGAYGTVSYNGTVNGDVSSGTYTGPDIGNGQQSGGTFTVTKTMGQ